MRMNIATDALMNRFVEYLLAHPERFVRSDVPCCLQDLWELALADLSATEIPQPLSVVEASKAGHTYTRVDAYNLVGYVAGNGTRQ